MGLDDVGEHQPIGVPPQIHGLDVPGTQAAGDERMHGGVGRQARLDQNIAARPAFLGAIMVLHEAIGVIARLPGRHGEEHHLLEVQIGAGHHYVADAAANGQPKFLLASKIGR